MNGLKTVAAIFLIAILFALGVWFFTNNIYQKNDSTTLSLAEKYAGTTSCRECHEKFYKLWASSFHGTALQPFSTELAQSRLTSQDADIVIGDLSYRVQLKNGGGAVRENGPDGAKDFRIEYAMGGKNIYYFLTPLEKGRLQVLPVAYDVNEKIWYDTTASMVRHAADPTDAVLDWRDRLLTFNTSCYSCHVSQLSTNYDPASDSYQTTWKEPGINCETCHGGGSEHVRAFREAPEGYIPADKKINSMSTFTNQQINDLCASCHAKMAPLTTTFKPGDRYFDHFTLAGLESPDFYPDGRDLGENYTYTLWLTSPCVNSGRLNCTHCHTSSGRYRFEDEQPNNACMPCHAEQVGNVAAHSHHPLDDESSRCISCHMPKTRFAGMGRSDHSMRPPTPAATLVYGSPNACNICHGDQDASWSDQYVRKWRARDFQAPILHRAGLIAAAREGDWTRLEEMLTFVTDKEQNEVFRASLIRLLRSCQEERKGPVFIEMLSDPSPLVRAAAAESMAYNLTPQIVKIMLKATKDEFRLVRIRAAAALAPYPRHLLEAQAARELALAEKEYRESLQVRLDDYASFYTLGNFYLDKNDIKSAITSFEKAIRLQPKSILPLINASIAYARGSRIDKAEESLHQALQLEPENPIANLNMGLLWAEQGNLQEAEKAFRTALTSDPDQAEAAYNLGIILASDRIDEALIFCRKAFELNPDEPKYAYTLAFYLDKTGDYIKAIPILDKMVEKRTVYSGIYLLLGDILERLGRIDDAIDVYRKAAANENMSPEDRAVFAAKIRTP